MDSSYWSIHGQAIILTWKQLLYFFDAFSLEKKRPLEADAASALNIPVNEVSDSLVVSQDKAKRFELTPVWAPAEPPTKRAKTAEVRLSSASNVPMPPTNDDNEKGSSDEEDSDSSLAQTLTLVAKTILQMCLIWKNSTKRTLTSVLSRKEWTHERWNGMAQLIQMKRSRLATALCQEVCEGLGGSACFPFGRDNCRAVSACIAPS